MTHRKQLTAFFIMLGVYALCAFIGYAFFTDQLTAGANVPMPDLGVSNTVLGLANAGIILVVYGIVGLAGYWFARKLELPGIFSADGNPRRWFLIPFVLGVICGIVLVIGDLLFAPVNGIGRFPHPPFPTSIIASISAGIGEEILTRMFVFGLWGLILNWLLKRFNGRTLALWIANIIAALAFGASHLGTVFILNGLIGLIAGERYMKDGLIAATSVHFWADVVFHVAWGLF